MTKHIGASMSDEASYRITYETDKGTIYSHVEFHYPEGHLSVGSWTAPFPNDSQESTAFGLIEAISQSDDCPPRLHEEEIVKVTVEQV